MISIYTLQEYSFILLGAELLVQLMDGDHGRLSSQESLEYSVVIRKKSKSNMGKFLSGSC